MGVGRGRRRWEVVTMMIVVVRARAVRAVRVTDHGWMNEWMDGDAD
jgi:hypothetical protein